MFEKLGLTEVLVLLAVALLFFGPAKLPQLGKSVGEGIREFKKAFRSAGSDDGAEKEQKE